MGHRARVLGFSGLVIGLLGMNLVTLLVPDGTEYANVVDLTQERLMETVRQVEFYKLLTGSYPSSLPALLAGNNEPIRSASLYPAPISDSPAPVPLPKLPSPIVMEEVAPLPDLPVDQSSPEPSPPIVAEPEVLLPPANCVQERIVYRDYAVSDLESSSLRWIEKGPSSADDGCRIQRVVIRDRPVRVALPGSELITDPTASNRQAFFYERHGDDRYYLRAVGPDGIAFTGDDIFPQIARTDATRVGLLEAREDVAAVEEGR